MRSARVDAPDITDLLGAPLHWQRVVAFAERHRVVALLARALSAAEWHGVPPKVVDRIAAFRVGTLARNLFLTTELQRLVALLEVAGLVVVPFKGSVLAMSAYGDLAFRSFGDIDLLVSRDHAMRAKELLIADGFASRTPHTDARRTSPHPVDYAFDLADADRDVAVEIHWKFAPWFPLRLEDVLPASLRTPLLRDSVNDLCPEHSIVAQCVHAQKEGWLRLEWVSALAHTIVRNPKLDWDVVLSSARRGGVPSVGAGLVLARRLCGAPVPPELLAPPTVTRRVQRTGDEACVGLLDADEVETSVAVHAVRRYFRNRGIRDQVRGIAALVYPSERDFAFVNLPLRLSFLYFGVRPVRLLVEQTPLRALRRRG